MDIKFHIIENSFSTTCQFRIYQLQSLKLFYWYSQVSILNRGDSTINIFSLQIGIPMKTKRFQKLHLYLIVSQQVLVNRKISIKWYSQVEYRCKATFFR